MNLWQRIFIENIFVRKVEIKSERVLSDVVEIWNERHLVSKSEFFGRKFPEVFGVVDLPDVRNFGEGNVHVRDHGLILRKTMTSAKFEFTNNSTKILKLQVN